jgi:ANTAR domain
MVPARSCAVPGSRLRSACRSSCMAGRSAAWISTRPGPRDWDDSEISALQTYASIVANLLGSAAAAHLKGRLAEQLHAALAHGAIIEQAKGVLMECERLDAATAYERLRTAARSSNRKVADVARELLADVPLPPDLPT